MLKIRVIPTLLWKNFGLVKGTAFDSWRRVGPVLPAIKVYNTRDVDELVLVDIIATQNSSSPDTKSVQDFADECFVPLAVGGGITNLKQMQELLNAGADKVIINTAAYSEPRLIEQAAERFGSQCILASIDARRESDDSYLCYSGSGKTATKKCPTTWAKELENRGAGEIIITSIDRDGSMQGYDLELIKQVTAIVNVPVIASGGAGSYEHMRQAIQEAGASAVAAASMFHFTEQTPAEAKLFLAKTGVPVRKTANEMSIK